MGLPNLSRRTSEVELPDGTKLQVKGLSRGQAVELSGLETVRDMEITTIAYGTGHSKEKAAAFYDEAPVDAIEPIINEIVALSGLDGGETRNLLNGA